MKPYPFSFGMLVAVSVAVTVLLTACRDSKSLTYSTRAEAAADSLFSKGWLPEIIPASSYDISTVNDLDLNLSNGEFRFDPLEHDSFVIQLQRASSDDQKNFTAYHYQEWIFWINSYKNKCRFHMRLDR